MHAESFSTGRVRSKRRERGLRRYLPGGWSDTTLPVNAFVLEHTLGLCVFDTGQTAAASRPGYHQRWHPFLWVSRFELEPEDELPRQLRARGFDSSDVRWVVLSHLHTDHVGTVESFRGAEVIVSRTEWQRAQGLLGKIRGYIPHRWPAGLEAHLVEVDGPAVGPFAGSFDIAGDGSLLLVPTPAHTPGHLSMLADAHGGRVLLGGDLAHTRAELARTAPNIATWCAQEGVRVLLAHEVVGEHR